MPETVLCVDVGSTLTKAVLVDADSGELLAPAEHPTTVARAAEVPSSGTVPRSVVGGRSSGAGRSAGTGRSAGAGRSAGVGRSTTAGRRSTATERSATGGRSETERPTTAENWVARSAAAGRPATGQDVLAGIAAVRERVEEIARRPVGELLVCSSAGGGLRLAVVGYEREVTAEAGRRVALSAGGRVVHLTCGRLDAAEVEALRAARPDVILLTGGTDGGDGDVVVHNARRLGIARLPVPVVLAANADAAPEAEAELTRRGRRVTVTDNVLPRIGTLDPLPARRAIRAAFLAHVIGGKGLSRPGARLAGRTFAHLVRAATPDAVLDGAALLASGEAHGVGLRAVGETHGVGSRASGEAHGLGLGASGREPGVGLRAVGEAHGVGSRAVGQGHGVGPRAVGEEHGVGPRAFGEDLLVVDVGGATTDVYSVRSPDRAAATGQPARQVVADLWQARTVEGDLGMRAGARGLLEAAVSEGLLAPDRAAELAARPDLADPGALCLPDDAELAGLALLVAVRRHGRPERPGSPPRPLREVGLVIGSGGVLRHADPAGRRRILTPLLHDHGGGWAVPDRAELAVDEHSVLFAAGLLAPHAPAAATALARSALIGVPRS